jgi:undecaprenyl-diphosphatase
MTSIQAIILGLVQGITEFFPISSSAHLILVPWLFNWDISAWSLDLQKTFDVALHVGTFIAVLVLMRVDVWRLLRAFFGSIRRFKIETRDEKLAWLLLISTIPAGIIGVAFESFIEDKLGEPWLIAILLIVFGAIMWAADSLSPRSKNLGSLRWYHALYIGVAQAAALAPGVSRSGVTLSALRGLRINREEAVRYAFLLTIPIIGGSAVYKGLRVVANGGLPAGTGMPFLLGTVTALVAGYLAARFLLGYVRSHSLRGFVWYRFALGALVLILIIAGLRPPTIG